jgi:4'-phosphopantetheinyl transferase
VHVWRARLTSVAPDLAELLREEERARAERILNKQEGELWRRSRGLLRELLGRYLELEPTSLRFVVGEHGKPALRDPASLHFNMSHSGGLALYAFSDAGPVGVDVELARRAVDEVRIAARMLGEGVARSLQALDPAARRREFVRAWASHEAELKCLGVGIGEPGVAAAGHRPSVVELELGPSAGAAVATDRQARELCCWDWPA